MNEQELRKLKKEIADLERKKEELIKEKNLRLSKIKLQLGNIPKKIQATTPGAILGVVGKAGAHAASNLSKSAYAELKAMADAERKHQLEIAKSRKGKRLVEA